LVLEAARRPPRRERPHLGVIHINCWAASVSAVVRLWRGHLGGSRSDLRPPRLGGRGRWARARSLWKNADLEGKYPTDRSGPAATVSRRKYPHWSVVFCAVSSGGWGGPRPTKESWQRTPELPRLIGCSHAATENRKRAHRGRTSARVRIGRPRHRMHPGNST